MIKGQPDGVRRTEMSWQLALQSCGFMLWSRKLPGLLVALQRRCKFSAKLGWPEHLCVYSANVQLSVDEN